MERHYKQYPVRYCLKAMNRIDLKRRLLKLIRQYEESVYFDYIIKETQFIYGISLRL